MGRSAWINQSVFGPPIGADPVTKFIYQHETGQTADGAALPATFTTGYFALSDGNNMVFIDEIWPDFHFSLYGNGTGSAVITLTVNVVDYPGQSVSMSQTFQFDNMVTFLSPRLRGRLLSITIASAPPPAVPGFWRLGLVRYRAQPDGEY